MSPIKEQESCEAIRQSAEAWSPQQTLRWAFATYGRDVAIASAFGPEGIALLDMAAQIEQGLRVFLLDTGYLFPETLELARKVERRYGIQVEHLAASLTPEKQSERHGPELWKRDPDRCCQLRKLEPLRRKLNALQAWITGIRRDQTPDRQHAGRVQWDRNFSLVKINPLVDWTSEMVWSYIRRFRLDYNPLHDRGYPSIGCVHCTRAVAEGESSRAGRWAGHPKLECGLHREDADSSSGLCQISISKMKSAGKAF
jgi:phosphoadenosine phosphosulfate reductase